MEEVAKLLKGILLLQLNAAQTVAEREGRTTKFELLLADAGFSASEIALMLGKSPGAVAKAITRARSARRGTADTSDRQLEPENEAQ